MEEQNKENIWNIANILTLSRVIITFIIIFLIFADFNIIYIVAVFIIGMLTDAVDGWVARRFKTATEFGRKFDIIADRVLMAGTVLALIIKFTIAGLLTRFYLLQIFLILSREIITFPFALIGMISGMGIPQVRFFGKATTFMQAVTFPLIMLSIFYEIFNFSIYFAIVTGIVGLISAIYFINDVKK